MIFFFDLDGTLAYSRQQIDNEMLQLLLFLMADHEVNIISGAHETQMHWQLRSLNERVGLFAQNGNVVYRDGGQTVLWKEELTIQQQAVRTRILPG